MFIDSCRTGKYVRHLLRDSHREGGKVRHTTLGNLSSCTDRQIKALKWALRFDGELPPHTPKVAELILRQGLSVGAVITLQQMSQTLGIEKALGTSQEGKLALWQVMARVIDQGSRLSATRLAGSHAVCDVLGLDRFCEDDLYENLDWLAEHQQAIENALFRQAHPDGKCDLYLYDVTSTYLEGMHNALAAFGYNRDGKKGKMQLVVGLLCDLDGRPLTIEVFKGNTQDPATVQSQIKKVAERFGGGDVTFVGDRGMLKSKQVEDLQGQGFHYITAITKPQIESLLHNGIIEMELFDDELAEVFPDEDLRYILRRNPVRAQEMLASRNSKLASVQAYVDKKNDYLKAHPKSQTAVALRAVQQRAQHLKIGPFVRLEEKNRELVLTVDAEAMTEAGELDGCYVLKTDLPAKQISKEMVNARYKDLSMVEWAFRTSKTGHLELRPIHVRTEESTRGHVFVVMLAYLIRRMLEKAWSGLDVTVEEGLKQLSTLCSIQVDVKGKAACHKIPVPREQSRELLQALDIQMPEFLPHR
ncbi:MAG: IS1634 family transposase, partial [Pseudomonadota bacterium]